MCFLLTGDWVFKTDSSRATPFFENGDFKKAKNFYFKTDSRSHNFEILPKYPILTGHNVVFLTTIKVWVF